MRRTCLYVFFVLIYFIFCGLIKAETIYVWGQFGDKIADAISQAEDGDIIIVKPWTYTGIDNVNLDFDGKAIEIRSESGPEVTIIDCQSASQTRAFKFENNETGSSKLIGFTLRNGNARAYPVNSGGAIFIGASPTIENCIFENCTAQVGGAIQIFNYTSLITPTIKNCTFKNNSTSDNSVGGAINCAKNASPTIENCIFDSNFSDYHGGAIHIGGESPSSIEILECIFQSNYTDGWGTIYVDRTTLTHIWKCTFVKNGALLGGTALAAFGVSSNVQFTRNIVAFNETTGLVCGNNALPTFSCNNFYQNNGGSIVGNCDSTDVDVNTIFDDPLFCDLDNDDFYISSYSPCDEDSSKCGLLIGRYDDNCDRCCNLAGDVNNDGVLDIGDLVYLIDYMFNQPSGPPPPCPEEADVDGSGEIDIADVNYLVDFMFSNPPGPAPVCP